MAFAIWFICAQSGNKFFTPAIISDLLETLLLGLVVVSAILAASARRTRPLGIVIGLLLGAGIPLLVGYVYFRWLADLWHGDGFSGWIEAVELCVPSGIAGALVGFLNARWSREAVSR